jgi:hypothetical protein
MDVSKKRALPESLLVFRVHSFGASTTDWLPHLPLGLSVLECSIQGDNLLEKLQSLPRGLETLATACRNNIPELVTPELVKSLPPLLVNLSLYIDEIIPGHLESLLDCLPPTLRTLQSNLFDGSNTLCAEAIAKLPRNLTNYPHKIYSWDCMRTLPLVTTIQLPPDETLPEILQKRNIPNFQELELPSSIRNLQVTNLDRPLSTILSKLPKLTNLTLVGSPSLSTIPFLPKSIRDMTLEYLPEPIMVHILPLLPRALTSLSIFPLGAPNQVLTATNVLDLPRTLENLSIFSSSVDESWFTGLPATLSYLSLGLVHFFTPQQADALSKTCPNLVSLHLYFNEGAVSSGWMRHMPQRLRTLYMNSIYGPLEFTAHDIASLPSTITDMSFEVGILCSEDWEDVLPRSLRHLKLQFETPSWWKQRRRTKRAVM